MSEKINVFIYLQMERNSFVPRTVSYRGISTPLIVSRSSEIQEMPWIQDERYKTPWIQDENPNLSRSKNSLSIDFRDNHMPIKVKTTPLFYGNNRTRLETPPPSRNGSDYIQTIEIQEHRQGRPSSQQTNVWSSNAYYQTTDKSMLMYTAHTPKGRSDPVQIRRVRCTRLSPVKVVSPFVPIQENSPPAEYYNDRSIAYRPNSMKIRSNSVIDDDIGTAPSSQEYQPILKSPARAIHVGNAGSNQGEFLNLSNSYIDTSDSNESESVFRRMVRVKSYINNLDVESSEEKETKSTATQTPKRKVRFKNLRRNSADSIKSYKSVSSGPRWMQ